MLYEILDRKIVLSFPTIQPFKTGSLEINNFFVFLNCDWCMIPTKCRYFVGDIEILQYFMQYASNLPEYFTLYVLIF